MSRSPAGILIFFTQRQRHRGPERRVRVELAADARRRNRQMRDTRPWRTAAADSMAAAFVAVPEVPVVPSVNVPMDSLLDPLAVTGLLPELFGWAVCHETNFVLRQPSNSDRQPFWKKGISF